MQKLLIVMFSFSILASCGTSPNNNGGSTTTVVPIAPSNLTGTVLSNSSVSLSWVDNSTNETGFKIERRLNGTTQFSVIGIVNADITGFIDSNLTANTSYEYRVYSLNAVGNSITYSNVLVLTTSSQTIINIPTITTSSVSSITNTTAFCGGIITNDGGAPITARGVIWSNSPSPTIALSTKTTDGTNIGSFTSNITGLTSNTTYYVCAYATNSVGTAYGVQESFTTTSGTVVNLPSVTIGTQIWSSKNLDVTRYRNGDLIPQVTDSTQWSNLTTGAWCWYKNDSATYAATYGRLYNWYAVNDPRGFAPQGWHVPSAAEWNRLTISIDPSADTTQCCSNVAGTSMKSTSGWNSNGNGTNSSGFAGLPGGLCTTNGTFYCVGDYGNWWCTNEVGSAYASYCILYYDASYFRRDVAYKTPGLSVRVVRD